jgi:hypothetical protein
MDFAAWSWQNFLNVNKVLALMKYCIAIEGLKQRNQIDNLGEVDNMVCWF